MPNTAAPPAQTRGNGPTTEEETTAPLEPAEGETTSPPEPAEEETTSPPEPAEEETTSPPEPAEEETTAPPEPAEPEDRADTDAGRPERRPAKAQAEPSAPSPRRADSPGPDPEVAVAPAAPPAEPATTASADLDYTGGVSSESHALVGVQQERPVDAPPAASPARPYGRAMGASIEAARRGAGLGRPGAWRAALSGPQAVGTCPGAVQCVVGDEPTVASQRDHTRSRPPQPAAPASRDAHHVFSTGSASEGAVGSAGAGPLAFLCGVLMAAAWHWSRLPRISGGLVPLTFPAVPERPG